MHRGPHVPEVLTSLLALLQKDHDTLNHRMLVGTVASLPELLEEAQDKTAIMVEVLNIYKTFLDTAVKAVALAEFSKALSGHTGLNKKLLADLIMPPCLIEDLGTMEVAGPALSRMG